MADDIIREANNGHSVRGAPMQAPPTSTDIHRRSNSRPQWSDPDEATHTRTRHSKARTRDRPDRARTRRSKEDTWTDENDRNTDKPNGERRACSAAGFAHSPLLAQVHRVRVHVQVHEHMHVYVHVYAKLTG